MTGPRAPRFLLLATAALSAVLLPAIPATWAADDEFSVMTYNLRRFSFEDRDQDGQADDFKPEEEVKAVLDVIRNAKPDVLAVQEIGDAESFARLRKRVAEAGLSYPHAEYFMMPEATVGLALLSRFPIVSRAPITNETYTIGREKLPVQRGFLNVEIEVNPNYRFRLLNAHLKSKRYHPSGQTEMRRNEARLLNKNVRRMLAQKPNLNLIVLGDLNDNITSATLREVLGQPYALTDLRLQDNVGDIWTHFWEWPEEYARIDYILVSEGMLPEVVREKSRVVRDPAMNAASDHRPVIAVFKAREIQP